uniref:SCP domain-containing protein n=1 Tax=Trichuris muris TaxID=70415 RepID=A0A5S6QGF5_TRIMR
MQELTAVALFDMALLAGLLVMICYGHFASTVHGKVIEISALDQATYLVEHNSYRKRPISQNMECVTGWSEDLAKSASQVAETCKTETPTNGTLGYMIHSSTRELTPSQVLQEVWTVYANAYNYLTNNCDLTLTNTCNNTLQLLWFEGGEIGCARSECTTTPTQYLTVCAYPNRALPGMRPHTIAPGLPVCSLCSTQFPMCRDDLCCLRPATGTGTATTTPAPTVGPRECGNVPRAQLVSFVRLYNNAERRNIFEISQQSVISLISQGVSNLGPVGLVANALNTTACPFMRVITVLKSDKYKTNFYTIDPVAINAAVQQGFVQSGTMGYAVAGNGMCGANTPIFSFFNPDLGYVQLSNIMDVQDLLAGRKWPGYQWRGVEFYIWQ